MFIVGRGFYLYLQRATFAATRSSRSAASKELMGFGGFLPVTFACTTRPLYALAPSSAARLPGSPLHNETYIPDNQQAAR